MFEGKQIYFMIVYLAPQLPTSVFPRRYTSACHQILEPGRSTTTFQRMISGSKNNLTLKCYLSWNDDHDILLGQYLNVNRSFLAHRSLNGFRRPHWWVHCSCFQKTLHAIFSSVRNKVDLTVCVREYPLTNECDASQSAHLDRHHRSSYEVQVEYLIQVNSVFPARRGGVG